jgi:hypothetical protein
MQLQQRLQHLEVHDQPREGLARVEVAWQHKAPRSTWNDTLKLHLGLMNVSAAGDVAQALTLPWGGATWSGAKLA